MNTDYLKNSRRFCIDSGLELLKCGGMIVMSWGISNIKTLFVNKEPRGMSFKVNGYKFQGTVVLSVNGSDYYDAHFYKDGEIVNKIEDLYVGDVIKEIDEYVEKQPEYNY